MRPVNMPSIPKLFLVIALGAAVGVSVSTVWHHGDGHGALRWLAGESSARPIVPIWAAEAQSQPALQQLPSQLERLSQASFPARSTQPDKPAARVAAQLLVAGVVHPVSAGRIALTSGTLLQLRMMPNRSGHLEVHAINPAGMHTGQALWSARASAGTAVQSPPMRLQGQRGMETLRVVLRSRSGDELMREEVELWHE